MSGAGNFGFSAFAHTDAISPSNPRSQCNAATDGSLGQHIGTYRFFWVPNLES